MVSDFTEDDPADVPSFFFHLGDVVYNFGEAQYYYDQFYELWVFAHRGGHGQFSH